jgi:A/G-specific adenine glycosylase
VTTRIHHGKHSVSTALLAWFSRHGRHALPWQNPATPYRVWVSEIMLQQTQVSTVVDYFERFVARFADVPNLADAHLDEVLHLWSGLGYYVRARNLHRSARLLCQHHDGQLPTDIDALQALPGIGRSTAGAILALAHGQRHPILDGNAKRVLCRLHAIDGWPGNVEVTRRLWAIAERHTPTAEVASYTQAIMDLGATVCTRRQPACEVCPLHRECRARQLGRTAAYPSPRPRRAGLPVRRTVFAIVRDSSGLVLLEKRPPTGVWGGLWSFPECRPDTDLAAWCLTALGQTPVAIKGLPNFRHTFTHFHLEIAPALLSVTARDSTVMEAHRRLWYNVRAPARCGLAAPVAQLLTQLP